MTAFSNQNQQLTPFLPVSTEEKMSNNNFPFLFYQDSSPADQPRSISSSVNSAPSVEKKKNTLISPANSKDAKNVRNKQQKKPACEEPSVGYIHVRARRGQATDSHSLAERVRREKISERMKVLQGLVPGCEKVIGKALMLDEIINYVQSLQNQVEFLSMKLACVNPMMSDFSLDYDLLANQIEKQFEAVGSMLHVPQPMASPPLLQASLILDRSTAKASEAMINPPPVLLQCQGPIPLSKENADSLLMQVSDQRQELLNHIMFSNMCMFQQGSKGEDLY